MGDFFNAEARRTRRDAEKNQKNIIIAPRGKGILSDFIKKRRDEATSY